MGKMLADKADLITSVVVVASHLALCERARHDRGNRKQLLARSRE